MPDLNQPKNITLKRVLNHAGVWALYTLFIFVTNYITDPNLKILHTVIFLLPFYLTFYITLLCLNLYPKLRITGSIIAFFMVFAIMSSVGYLYIYSFLPSFGIKLHSSDEFKPFLKGAVIGYIRYFTYALLYYHIRRSFRRERDFRKLMEAKLKDELENAILKQQEFKSQKDKLSLECAFLRAQINPHFLHNTLNVLFSQAMEYSPNLADNISKLSQIMRYSMESVEYESDKVLVQKELDNLQLLIEVNNLRFDYSKVVDYKMQGELNGQMIPPLSLITIVENAFKYGDLKDANHPLIIRVDLNYHEIHFYCKNKKKKNNLELSSHSIGISNLSKRLDAAFKGKYIMNAFDEREFYTFELTVKT